jgi:glycosyltransferase involved in cell wall biosynthesis
MIGTRGVPARYGGFETCVEEVGSRLADRGHDVVVFCRRSSAPGTTPSEYRRMDLVWLPTVHSRTFETLAHTTISVLHRSLSDVDAALVFNAANAPLLPVIRARGIPVATHVDGLEWKRAKWGGIGRHYYRAAEALSVRWSNELIADAQGIADYYRNEFDASTSLISYGAPIIAKGLAPRLAELNLAPAEYHLVVARFEPENHVLEIVEGYSRSSAELPLVVVGSAPYSAAYTKAVTRVAGERVRFLGGVWDHELLDQLYAGALTYLHGHSVGGTNPSLLRAAGAGAYPIAFDVSFNHEVVGEFGEYFSSPSEVGAAVVKAELDRCQAVTAGLQLQGAIQRYNWDDVAEDYEQLCARLSSLRLPARGPSGRRQEHSRNRRGHLVVGPLRSFRLILPRRSPAVLGPDERACGVSAIDELTG